ncbi:Methyltransferase-like protein 22 [Podila minutissima]|nr:Methyltransferase-like protein 22 [Podila minutissima]
MGTSLRNVGSQVWMGCFLLTDYMVELGSLLDGCVALELGAGTGISSIASGILTNVRKMFCTDFDAAVLSNCQHNVDLNRTSIKPGNKIVTRRLNWFLPCPMETVEGEVEDEYSWTPEDVREWTDEGAFIFAADVVYDDSLTDVLVECLEQLLTIPLPTGHPRHEHGRVAFMTMEKRYNFSLNELDVVAQAHDYFVQKMGRSTQLHLTRLDTGSVGRHCDYERTKDLELFQITCRQTADGSTLSTLST